MLQIGQKVKNLWAICEVRQYEAGRYLLKDLDTGFFFWARAEECKVIED